jgi:Zn finger protein HypA/HybF involved in hydrogenase expression
MESSSCYCRRCHLIFSYEQRDLILGELLCPSCTERADPRERGSEEELRRLHPQAASFRIDRPLLGEA